MVGCGVNIHTGVVFFTHNGRFAATVGPVSKFPSGVAWAVSFERGAAYVLLLPACGVALRLSANLCADVSRCRYIVGNFGSQPFLTQDGELLDSSTRDVGAIAPVARGVGMAAASMSGDAAGGGTALLPQPTAVTVEEARLHNSIAVMRNHLQVWLLGVAVEVGCFSQSGASPDSCGLDQSGRNRAG